jgi:hypothetical protein
MAPLADVGIEPVPVDVTELSLDPLTARSAFISVPAGGRLLASPPG